MSSRFADPTPMRRSPIYYTDDAPKRPPPSPSNKAPPPKKLDAKSRPVSEEPCPPPKPSPPLLTPSSEFYPESCMDKSSLGNRAIIDMSVFQQILELDEDDDDQEFSRDMVREYLDQTQATMKLMDECYAKHDLTQLGKHGHYLKGSSAALGVIRVQEICEKIQHLGNRTDPDKDTEVKISISSEDAFARIKPLLTRLKDELATAAKCLNNFFDGPKP